MREELFEKRLALPVPVQVAWDWHMRPDAFMHLSPPDRRVEIVEDDGVIADGSRLRMKVYLLGPIYRTWLAEHRNVDPPNGFRDVQLKGPFAAWTHDHLFEPTDTGCVLIDRVRYAVPGGAVGRWVGGGFIRRDLERLFAHRHAVTLDALTP